MIENLHFIKDLGLQSQSALESGNLEEFARLMDLHWQRKKQRSGGMSNLKINEWYDLARANGALGGKLIGAGGGGFLMFYAEEKTRLRHSRRHTFIFQASGGAVAARGASDAFLIIASTSVHAFSLCRGRLSF